jgi:RimJ/RimL family protein N-acetyltransferase
VWHRRWTISARSPTRVHDSHDELNHPAPRLIAGAWLVFLLMANEFSELTLSTPRIVLRPLSQADIPDVRLSCADDLTQRWLPLPSPCTLEAATDFCTMMAPRLRESGDGFHSAMADPASGRLVGSISLKKTDWQTLTSEVGYWVSPWARGRGLAAEATRTLAEWLLGEQGFERLELRAATGNTASQRVADKAGFTREGVLRNAGLIHAGRVDLAVYSKISADLAD